MGVAFVAHCLLNQNSKVRDGAHCAGVYSPIVDVLRAKGWRVEQMPCPELAFAGLNRFWAVREQYDTVAFRRHCQRLATAVAGAIAARAEQGEEIVLVGVEGSPSMGTTITSSDPDDLLPLLRPGGDRARHGDGEPATVPPERRGVVLLTYRPEPVQPGKGKLGAGHLLDAPARGAQHVHDGGIHARAVRTVTHLGILIQQAMCHERNAHGPSIRRPLG